ncbi:MAG: 50S ribosomal protein L30 [Euryarchaeota archaeon]|nr:50S ribosomal protein L30 [Euryarchaeota archaeon]
MTYAVVKIRSIAKTKPDIRRTLKLLNLDRTNHCVLVNDNVHYNGMLQKVKDYVAWGDINGETLSVLLEKRGMLEGHKRLTSAYLKDQTAFGDIESLAKAVVDGKATLRDVPKLKPVLRLHPPRRGHKGIKKPFPEGVLGFHGSSINELLLTMR